MLGHVGTCWDMFGDFSDLDQKNLKKHPRSQFPTVGNWETTNLRSEFPTVGNWERESSQFRSEIPTVGNWETTNLVSQFPTVGIREPTPILSFFA